MMTPLRITPYKWLDFLKLATMLLGSNNEVIGVKYFTALVKSTIQDPNKTTRQLAYINALKSCIPNFVCYFGKLTVKPTSANNSWNKI